MIFVAGAKGEIMSKYVNAADAAEKIAEKHGIRIADLCDTFGDIPAADVAAVQHGRWRWVAYDANPKIGNWHCTYCNRIPKSFQKEDFCPNCGAKMDKEDA